MLLLLLIYVVLRALWKIDVYLTSTLVNNSLYYYYYKQPVVRHWKTKVLPWARLIVLYSRKSISD